MLRQVLLLQRDVPKATRFYQEGLGLKVKVLTERWAELDAGSTTLALKAVEGYVRSNYVKLHMYVHDLNFAACSDLLIGTPAQGGLLHHRLHPFPVIQRNRFAANGEQYASAWWDLRWPHKVSWQWQGSSNSSSRWSDAESL